MLPQPLQFIIAMVISAINERIARRIDCLMAEAHVLREACKENTGRKRLAFIDEQRRRLGSTSTNGRLRQDGA